MVTTVKAQNHLFAYKKELNFYTLFSLPVNLVILKFNKKKISFPL